MIHRHEIVSRDMRVGDTVSTNAHQNLAAGLDSSRTDAGEDVALVRIADDNHGDSFFTEWSDGSAFDVHPGLRITVTRHP